MTITRRVALAQLLLSGIINTALAHWQAASAETATYTYDALGRVVTVTFNDGTTIVYTYDPLGNRTQVTQTPAPPPPPPVLPPGTVVFNSSTAGAWSHTFTTTQNYDIEVWGPGGGGAGAVDGFDPKEGPYHFDGYGAAGGGYCFRQFAVTAGNAASGQIGEGGAGGGPAPNLISQSATGGVGSTTASYSGPTLTADAAVGGYAPTGGTAAGGTTNINGRNGSLTNFWDGGGAGNGGGDQTTPSAAGTAPGGGGAGGVANGASGGAGVNGRVLITAR